MNNALPPVVPLVTQFTEQKRDLMCVAARLDELRKEIKRQRESLTHTESERRDKEDACVVAEPEPVAKRARTSASSNAEPASLSTTSTNRGNLNHIRHRHSLRIAAYARSQQRLMSQGSNSGGVVERRFLARIPLAVRLHERDSALSALAHETPPTIEHKATSERVLVLCDETCEYLDKAVRVLSNMDAQCEEIIATIEASLRFHILALKS